MTVSQQVITILMCVLATQLTRFLPFAVFGRGRETPQFIKYIGKYLPGAVFGMLVVYCLRSTSVLDGGSGTAELISVLVTAGLHLWKRKMLLSIAGGTAFYMLLISFMK